MKKKFFAALTALCIAIAMVSCGESSSQGDSSKAESSSSAAESSSSTTDSSKADSSSEAAPVYDYEHGTDGYYNLAEELEHFKMPMQESGTCWLHAAYSSMSTAYEKQTGKELKIHIMDMLNYIYGDDKQEGVFLDKGVDAGNLGGWQWLVTERISKGYNGIAIDSSVIIDPTDREAIKNAIKTRGGIAAETYDVAGVRGMFGNYVTAIYTGTVEYDHDVTLIGWDDHFPKEYFNTPASQDGAWISYNSALGGAYCYISYDAPLGYTISHTVTDKYDVLSYDAGNEMDRYIQTGDSTKTANVFHKKGKLAAVGTYNDFDKQDIKIEIMSADFKNVLFAQDAVLDYHGYHTVELTTPVDAEDCAVVITYSKGAPVEGENIKNGDGEYRTVSEKGQSFVFADGAWKDLSDADAKTVLKTDFAPNNACIKALYAK